MNTIITKNIRINFTIFIKIIIKINMTFSFNNSNKILKNLLIFWTPKAAAPAKKAGEPAEEKKEVRPEDVEIPDIPYDLMTVDQLQAVILAKMAKNGPVTERMRQDVIENIWHNSLVNWANSFR